MAYILNRHVENRVDTGEVTGPLLRIGRGTNAELRFNESAVALEHARIQEVEGQYVLTDQGSVTGCYVNGKRVQSVRLTDGDRLEIGPFFLDVRVPRPGGPLSLDIRPAVASTVSRRGKLEAPKIDYVAAYALKRGFLNKTLLTVIIAFGGGALLATSIWSGKNNLFRPGSVSVAHALFTNQCSRCHQAWNGPSEKACKECHTPAAHHGEEAYTPSCLSCHLEHGDKQELAQVSNRQCVNCHSDLRTKGGTPSMFAKRVTDFAWDHPEFAITIGEDPRQKRFRLDDPGARQSDLAKIKLNHELHLKPGLKGPKGPVQLACRDCHRPAADNLRMAPVTYEWHCKECHELGFDLQFPDRLVPHEAPEDVHAYILTAYTERGDEMLLDPRPARRLPESALPSAPSVMTPSIFKRVSEAEAHLYKTSCTKCHEVNREEGRPYPKIEETAIPSEWFPHARFTHKSHQPLRCASCHEDVPKSAKTTDVLLPGIQTCRACHRAAKQGAILQPEQARVDCVGCHIYHDKSKKRDWDGPFTIRRLLSGVESGEPQPASAVAR